MVAGKGSRRRKKQEKRALQAREQEQAATPVEGLQIEGLVYESYEGPLPPPTTLAQFEQAVPGSSEIILDELRLNSAHRRKQESRVVLANTWAFFISNTGAWLVDILALIGGLALIYVEKEWWGVGVILSEIAWLRYGRKK